MTTLRLWLKRERAYWRYASALLWANCLAPLHKLELDLAKEEFRRWMTR